MTRPQPAPKLTEAQRRVLWALVLGGWSLRVSIAIETRLHSFSLAPLLRRMERAGLIGVVAHHDGGPLWRILPAGLAALTALEAADPLSPGDTP